MNEGMEDHAGPVKLDHEELVEKKVRPGETTIGEHTQQPTSWKDRLVGLVTGKKRQVATGIAAAAILGGGAATAEKVQDANSDPYFGQPVENATPFEATLIHSENNKEEDVPPVFRAGPTNQADELTQEQLKEAGIDPSNPNIKVLETYGQTYASDSKAGSQEHPETGNNHGIWGEVIVPGPDGEEQPTGIFVSGNFFSKDEEPANQDAPTQ